MKVLLDDGWTIGKFSLGPHCVVLAHDMDHHFVREEIANGSQLGGDDVTSCITNVCKGGSITIVVLGLTDFVESLG